SVTPELREAIEEAISQFAVLILRDQQLSQSQQIAFTKSFGPLDLGLKKATKSTSRLEHYELADISNVALDGSIAARDNQRILTNMANQLWHSDSSFQQPPARYSMLYSVVNPHSGGETEYADMRAAYDALSPNFQRELESLEAEHFALHSRMMLGNTG